MEEILLKIEDAIAGESEDSVAEWLERIRHELFIANAINLLHFTFNHKHSFDDRDIDKHLKAAMEVLGRH